ncbi:WD40-repeat-containing domain protein [Linnemannia elongata]|nr:WD40-repeat-containing domain protein [Linnemannia elongata]
MSLSPPPRKQSLSSPQRSPSARYPKINTNALSAAYPSIKEDDQDVEKDLANFFASTSLTTPTSSSSSSTSPTPLPDRNHYTRPSSIATFYSPVDPSDSSWSSKTSPQPCPLGHHHHLHHHELDGTQNGGHEQDMALAGPMLPSCSYCSSARSNSISSIMEETHSSQIRERNSAYQCLEGKRRDALRDLVPSEVRHRLTFHLDECWFVHFSPSGQYLVSVGLDQVLIIWQDLMTPEPSIFRTINIKRSITHVTWSPDSKYLLLNLGYDGWHKDFIYELQVIEVESGEFLFTRASQDSTCSTIVSDVAWFPDSQRFLYTDDRGRISIYNLKGDIIQEYTVEKDQAGKFLRNIPGTNDFAVLTSSLTLDIHSFGETHTIRSLGAQPQRTTIVNVSHQGRYAVVTVRNDKQIHRPSHLALYDLKSMTYIRAFEAETLKNDDFMIIPTFIGPNEEILCSGSEDGKLYLWDVETGDLISVLDEHSKHAGCMASNLVHPGIMASCSDDNHIIVWVTKELQSQLQESDEKWLEKRRQSARPAFDIKKGW